LPTIVFAQIIRDIVIPHKNLSGLYHVASQPINKSDLLGLIAKVYGKSIQILPDERLVIDRSLNSNKFLVATDYVAPEWPELIRMMHAYK
jgi:dTDP-4-dehydrorhamnose reductase